ncbi:Monocarboxylate transporter 12-like 10 [Homarus americanus]|uniref:Monocarboxylate transporter 12-like 10 n=1 Tax=Homarus americanus TaxID=6706 RepID=A0A8J5JJ64_HOMAM|nr:Monocarboxylate transporter 12-like 10 [Homarus americanus]
MMANPVDEKLKEAWKKVPKNERNIEIKSDIPGWLGGLSTSVALLVSPLTIAVCRRNSTRLTAVLGGLITALGCLFTSFASQFHQLFFSYGTVIGIGVGMTRDSSTLMVGQYFKRRREFVEIIVVSGSGLGITVMSVFIRGAIGSIGWRLGLQAVTGVIFLTFLMGTFYRSASLYHPQRRAILHLKNQKRKVKEKNRPDDKPPFFDVATLKSRTVQILLVSIGLSSFGITTPIIYLAHQAEEEGLGEVSVLLLQTYLGLGWVIGCCAFGFVVLQKNTECRVGRQYLCYHGYVLFAWLYGIFCGGFHYSLKMYTYEKVRARNFARTSGGSNTCVKETCPESRRRDSLAQLTREPLKAHTSSLALLHQRSIAFETPEARNKPELTCISEEGIADMDIPDHLLEDLEYLGDCITSCDKVENYLLMSEYENNLVKTNEIPYILDRRGRKRLMSITKQSSSFNCKDSPKKIDKPPDKGGAASSSSSSSSTHEAPSASNQRAQIKSGNHRSITVIEEASV